MNNTSEQQSDPRGRGRPPLNFAIYKRLTIAVDVTTYDNIKVIARKHKLSIHDAARLLLSLQKPIAKVKPKPTQKCERCMYPTSASEHTCLKYKQLATPTDQNAAPFTLDDPLRAKGAAILDRLFQS